jgi:competence protein ComEA
MPEVPLSRRQLLVGGLVALVLLILAGRLLLRPGASASVRVPAPVVPSTSASAGSGTSAAPGAGRAIVVDVVGAVRRPGLYRLTQGARVADALSRAGGATPRAQLDLVNLAAPISDGEQVVVPRQGAAVSGSAAGGGAPAGAAAGPVHLNTATLEQLDALPGVGPVTAQKILDYRQKHGAFGSVDELDAIPGIGPARLDQLRDLVAP